MSAMKTFLALVTLLAACAFPSLAADPSKCKLVQITEWPVRLQRNLPVIEGSINGKKIGVLLDTGSHVSLITKAAAEKLDLPTRLTSEWVVGFGGASRVLATRLEEVRIEGAVVKNMRVRVGGERPIPGVDFILGQDFFGTIDIEFDYAKGVVRLFQAMDCKGAWLAYWDKNALQLPMEDEKHVIVPIKVNGRESSAMVDSGASSSVISLTLASKVGITPNTPGVVSADCSSGIGGENVHAWVARFDSVKVGEETISDPRLKVADYLSDMGLARNAPPEVVLGTDFLKAHRMLISRSQGKVYFSYTGGLIFPATPSLDCDDRSRGKSVKESLAVYDQALEENPRDVKALLNRAVLRIRVNDIQGALSDVDAVIRIEPNNAAALATRMGVHAALKDYDGALADADAAIANGMRTAQMYVNRAVYRRAQGEREHAIEELDEALKLDPRHQGALRERARSLFMMGRFEAAENDLTTLLAIRPDGFDSIWLSFSRARRGLNGDAALEQALARQKDAQWPAPVVQYLLGRLDREALIAAAGTDESKRKGQECEARFYVAERFIASGQGNDARPLLEKARDECPRGFIEQDAAVAELARLR